MRAERVRGWAQLAVSCALVLAPFARAHAYCRTTTCDTEHDLCPTDEHGCVTIGEPLYWPDACVTVWVPSDPQLPGVSAAMLEALTQEAFASWRDVSCGSDDGEAQRPALDVLVAGSECVAPSNDEDEAPQRVNVIRAVTEDWPHPGGFLQIALTTVGFSPSTGEIRGFEIELNAADQRFTTSDTAIEADLLSTLTHEAGHALGLAHSDVPGATMLPNTGRTTRLRTLEVDDAAGICEIYPPAPADDVCESVPKADPEAVCAEINARASALTHHRQAHSGCAVRAATPSSRNGGPALLAVLALVLARRGRRKTASKAY